MPPPQHLALADVSRTEITAGRPILGSPNATTTVVVFGDYQCSPCASAFPILEKAVRDSGGLLKLVYHSLPSASHPNAFSAATVAEYAALYGDYWSVHRELYKTYGATDPLDVQKASKDLRVRQQIQRSIALARRLHIRATPTLILYEPGKSARQTTSDEMQQCFREGLNER